MSTQTQVQPCSHLISASSSNHVAQPASLVGLPSEILAAIITYVLPPDVHQWYCLCRYDLSPTFGGPQQQSSYRYAVLSVSKRLLAISLHILESRHFGIKINEKAFLSETSFDKQVDWIAKPPCPGLDLTRIPELVVELVPTDSRVVWDRLRATMADLCSQQLLPRGPLKKLRLEIGDVDWSHRFRLRSWEGLPVIVWPSVPVNIGDYKNVLEPFKEVASMAGQCEIWLPYWMERCKGRDHLVQEWGQLGARVLFRGGSFLSRDMEIRSREWDELAPLPDELFPAFY